jgi:hypothetical protein
MTVGELKNILEGVEDEAIVLIYSHPDAAFVEMYEVEESEAYREENRRYPVETSTQHIYHASQIGEMNAVFID